MARRHPPSPAERAMFDVKFRFTSCMPFTGPPGDSGRELPSETIGNRLSPVYRFALLHHKFSPFGLCKIAPAHCMRWLFDVAPPHIMKIPLP